MLLSITADNWNNFSSLGQKTDQELPWNIDQTSNSPNYRVYQKGEKSKIVTKLKTLLSLNHFSLYTCCLGAISWNKTKIVKMLFTENRGGGAFLWCCSKKACAECGSIWSSIQVHRKFVIPYLSYKRSYCSYKSLRNFDSFEALYSDDQTLKRICLF